MLYVTDYECTGDPKEVIETRCAVDKSQFHATILSKLKNVTVTDFSPVDSLGYPGMHLGQLVV